MKLASRFVAVGLAGCMACWGSVAPAQDKSPADEFLTNQKSRVHPASEFPDQPPPFMPPTNRPVVNESHGPEKVEPPVETGKLVETVDLCMRVVSPRFEVKPQILSEGGWGYTSLQTGQRGSLSYEYVNYYKGNLTVSLQDFSKFVDCRSVGRISGEGQLSDIRASLIKTLRATPITDTPGMERYVAGTRQGAPQTNFENLLVVGDYLVEFWQQSMSTEDLEVEGHPTLELAIFSVVPLPEKFQTRNRTAAQ
jgi:hypothetical protein